MKIDKTTIENALSWELICRHYGLDYKENRNISCPLGSHDDSQPSFSFFDHNKFKCHSCGESGDFFHFIAHKEKLDCDQGFPEVLKKASEIANVSHATENTTIAPLKCNPKKTSTVLKSLITKELIQKYHNQFNQSQGIKDYLLSRAIDPEKITEALLGFGSCKMAGGNTRLIVPYFGIKREPLFFRYLGYKNEGGYPKVISEKGTDLFLYIPIDVSCEEEIYLCEGELDVLTLLQHGVPAIGVPGVNSFKSEWLKVFENCKSVTLCFDNDKAGEINTEKVSKILKETFPSLTINVVKWKDKPAKYDVNDFFKDEGSVDGFLALKEQIKEQNLIPSFVQDYLNTSQNIKVGVSDVIANTFFHTYPIINEDKIEQLVLFSDGSYTEVIPDKKKSKFHYKNREYSFKTELEEIPAKVYRPDKEALKAFFKRETPDKTELYQKLVDLILEFYDFYSEEEVHIIAANIIHSYIINAIGRTFYLMLDGAAGTGKSSLQTLLSQLQYNGYFSGKVTAATIVRLSHFFQCAQNIDELDKFEKDDKKVVTGVLNTGYLKNGTYEITNMDRKGSNQIQVFHTFGTRSFSVNKGKFDPSLLSRCITINTVKNQRKIKPVFSASVEDSERFQNLRNQLFIYTLFNWKELIEAIKTEKEYFESIEKYGRPADVYSIVCGIFKHFCNSDSLRDILMQRQEFEVDSNTEDDRMYQIMHYLVEHLDFNTKNTMTIRSSEIIKSLEEDFGIEKKYCPSPQSITAMLKSYRLIDQNTKHDQVTSGENKGRKQWHPKTKRVVEMIFRSEYKDLHEKLRKIGYSATGNFAKPEMETFSF